MFTVSQYLFFPPHYNDFHAVIVRYMHMICKMDIFLIMMLNLCQRFRKIVHMMIVNYGNRTHYLPCFSAFFQGKLFTYEITNSLASVVKTVLCNEIIKR